DKRGFAKDTPRQHGYAPIGTPCVGQQDWMAKGRINAIGALFASLTVSLFTGTIDSNTFYAWLEQDLLPKLPPKRVVIMDNAAFHKRADIRQLLEQAGHVLEYLPTIPLSISGHLLKPFSGKKAARLRSSLLIMFYNHFIVLTL
ncbi:MAG: transposase, partial [Pseudomonadota bacterium]|nr:transposase [Pseudomonadota bacterium]